MILALAGALAIGLSLGLMGSGGSILTVPVLTYVVGQDEKVAIAGSLAIVGAIALFGGLPYARSGLVDYASVAFFGLPAMGGAYLGAFLSRYVTGSVQLAVFAVLMLAAGFLMYRPPRYTGPARKHRQIWKIALEGIVVGTVTGFVGVGGGFLIVPSLVLLGGLSMNKAVGTSLFIIALNSASGFYKYLDVLDELGLTLDWKVIQIFILVGVVGSFAGRLIGARVPQLALRRAFAVFLFIMGAAIVASSWQRISSDTAATGGTATGDVK